MITLKELQTAFPATQEETLTKVHAVILGCFNSDQLVEEFTDCDHLARQSYGWHTYAHMQMIAINQLLEAHGVESIEHNDNYYDYVNMGDMDVATIIDNGDLIISAYSDFREELEQ